MITVNMAGVVLDPHGKLRTVAGYDTIYQQQMLCILGERGNFWATPAELYRRGYRLVAAKPAVWDLWGRVVCASDLGERSSLVQ